MKDFKYKTIFSSHIKCLVSEERDKFLSKASINSLKSIIPESVKTQQDLLCIAANAFVANLGNLNGDMVSTTSTLDFYNNFINKGINLEHNRKNYCGHIIATSLSEFDGNYNIGAGSKIIEASVVKGKLSPFNVSIAGVIYKVYSEDLTNLIEASNDPNSEEYLKYSISWELGYNSYSLAVGSKYLEDCEVITDEKEIDKLSKYLLGNGGGGKLPDGKLVYRLVDGEVLPLGVAITSSPAAAVSGIVVDTIDDEKDILANLINTTYNAGFCKNN